MSFCPRCGKAREPGGAFCASCGQPLPTDSALPAYTTAPAPAAAPPAPTGAPRVSSGAAIAGLLLNFFIWPGLGTLVAGDKRGWAQGFLALGGGALIMFAVFGFVLGLGVGSEGGAALAVVFGIAGLAMWAGAWIWALITSVQHLTAAK